MASKRFCSKKLFNSSVNKRAFGDEITKKGIDNKMPRTPIATNISTNEKPDFIHYLRK
jgi:hypothetical protein